MHRWTKAALVGALGAVLMWVVTAALFVADLAPYAAAPPLALLTALGAPSLALAWLLQLAYGAVGAVALVAISGPRVDLRRGLTLAGALWLLLMLVWSPLIGWGVFGAAAGARPAADALHLASTGGYLAATLLTHAVYGAAVGLLAPAWIDARRPASTDPTATEPAEEGDVPRKHVGMQSHW